jgi:hypothetical protein
MNAYENGIAAYKQGLRPSSNPYILGTKKHADWFRGWNAARQLAYVSNS